MGPSAGRADFESERWRRIDRVLEEAFDQPAETRKAILAARLGDDLAALEEALALLEADARAGSFLDEPPGPLVADLVSSAWLGRRVGPYRLREVLGYGGMGTVFRAERDDGEFRQQVAVKLLAGLELGSEQRARFRVERQVLARLEHPNIARLYDGGTTSEGCLYLVMELIEGLPIDRFCDQGRLSIEARVDLFLQVLEAVRQAHQSLLVHRDLKPSNILVTFEGVAKLLDFGIAKQLDPAAGGGSTTAFGRPLSLRYASPEQVLGEPTTTTSDVYSLGVVLYELLSGQGPYRTQGEDRGLARSVCEDYPEAPSAVIVGRVRGLAPEVAESAARCRGFARPEALAWRLRGDLDAIVLKALRKEPGERYGSVEQLAEDLSRHRRHLPVRARRAHLRYRVGRFVERHRLGVAAGVLLLGASFLGVGNYVWQARRVLVEKEKAEAALAVLIDAFGQADFNRTGGTVTAREVLERGKERVERDLGGQPLIQAALLHAIGEAYSGIGEWEQAEGLLQRALDSRRRGLGETHPETALSRLGLGVVLRERARLESAKALLHQAVEDLESALGDQHLDYGRALRERGRLLGQRRRFKLAAADLERAHAILDSQLPDPHPDVLRVLTYRAELSFAQGSMELARRFQEQALEVARRLFGPENPEVAYGLENLGAIALDLGHLEEGEALTRRSLEMLRGRVDSDHPLLLVGLHNLAFAASRQGRLEEAVAGYREVLVLARGRYGDRHPEVATTAANLGLVLLSLGELGPASEAIEEALEISRQVYGDYHPGTGFNLCILGNIRRRQKDLGVARVLIEGCLETLREVRGDDDHPDVEMARLALTRVDMDSGRWETAEPVLRRIYESRHRRLKEGHWRIGEAAGALGVTLAALGRLERAEELLVERRILYSDHFEPEHPWLRRAEAAVVTFHAQHGPRRDAEAEPPSLPQRKGEPP